MVAKLGANITNVQGDRYLEDPVTNEPIVIIPDPCHMLKLIRNKFAERTLNKVSCLHNNSFSIIHPQLESRFHIKPTTKVKLAAQNLSTRVANALTYMKMKFPNNFQGADATLTFCKNVNDSFDILNSRRKLECNRTYSCITIDNVYKMETKINELIEYIRSHKVIENGKIILILDSKQKIGFWGFIVGMKSALKLAKYVFNNNLMSYLLTYKLSQDHLETFFSALRKWEALTTTQRVSSLDVLIKN